MRKLKLPFRVKCGILACGADMKGAFALAKGSLAYLFDGFGDLSDIDNFAKYEKAVKAAIRNLNIRPKIVACDLHPGYFSTQFAKEYTQNARRSMQYEIQHHEAHIASAIIDNDVKGEVVGAAFDGTGYGRDDNIWGGEFFTGTVKNFKRMGSLGYIAMPGGEQSIKEPWRMAASYLYSAFGDEFLRLKIDFIKSMDKRKWKVLKSMIDKKINSPLTSSMGRFFDAAASLVLNKKEANLEAELPIKLEKIALNGIDGYYDSGSAAKIIKDIVKDLEKKEDAGVISAKFHNTIADMILKTAKKIKISRVVLSGGVFQNKFLTYKTFKLLNKNGFKVYMNSGNQTNDSGIPLGQIAIANARIKCA